MQVAKSASAIFISLLLAACSTNQTAQNQNNQNFNPNDLPATAAGNSANGQIRYWEFNNIEGNTVADIYKSPDYPRLYNRSKKIKEMSITPKITNGAIRIAGYIYPIISGEYYFQINAETGAELWISTDQNAFKKKKIIHLDNTKHSEKSKAAIQLKAGNSYFIEAIAKINQTTDTLNVLWSYPRQTETNDIESSPMETIQGDVLSPYNKDKIEATSKDYLDGQAAGYNLGYSDAMLGLKYTNTLPATDTDYDGIPDRWEEVYGLDPLDYNDAGLDSDGDNLTAFEEFIYRTEPYIADTDNDGIPDGWEVENGIDPNAPSDATLEVNGATYLDAWMISTGMLPPPKNLSKLTINWQAPSLRINGDDFTEEDIQYYIIRYQLVNSDKYTDITLAAPYATTYTIENIEPGNYIVTISVVDNDEASSEFSKEIEKVAE